MAQPKTPPLSVRLPPWLLEHVKAEAASKGLKVNAELVAVLTRAYRLGEKAADLGATPAQVMKVARSAEKPVPVPKLSVSLPYVEDLKRPIYQKGSKK